MRILLSALTASHAPSKVLRLRIPLCWIPVFTVLVARPVATWSFHSVRSLAANPRIGRPIISHPHCFMRRKTTRSAGSTAGAMAKTESEGDETPSRKRKTSTAEDSPKKSTAKKKSSAVEKTKVERGVSPRKATRPPRGAAAAAAATTALKTEPDEVGGVDALEEGPSPTKKRAKKASTADHQRITERDVLPRLWDSTKASDSYTFRIASWNVAGLRAVLRNEPTALADLCRQHNLDMLCLQETKLQEIHLEDPKLDLRGCVEGYDDYWSCSTEKKGYSGTAVFVKQRGGGTRKKQGNISSFFEKKKNKLRDDGSDVNAPSAVVEPEVDRELVGPSNISYSIGKPIDNEGRTITLEFPFATITNVYVPNSGQKLERLDYRTNEWDKDFLAFQREKEKQRGLPVIWLGDLNIAHKAYDIWNDGAKHLATQAGVTEQERISFQAQLDAGYVDAFRFLHPEAKGHYSYWSQRAGNREPNKGLRLDYFVCSPELFSEESLAVVRDSYMIPERSGSDHAPVVLELEIKRKK